MSTPTTVVERKVVGPEEMLLRLSKENTRLKIKNNNRRRALKALTKAHEMSLMVNYKLKNTVEILEREATQEVETVLFRTPVSFFFGFMTAALLCFVGLIWL